MPETPPAADWPGGGTLDTYRLVIGQIACPAYLCSPDGVLWYCNRAARRLWGDGPTPEEDRCWDGFTALYRPDGSALDKSASPAVLAARTGQDQPPVELVAESADGQRRRVVIHARPVRKDNGATVGVICSLTDVSEKRRFEEAVRFAHDSRASFLHVLAHELRNPLAPVMAAATILQRQAGSARMAGVIVRQARQLARFIDDLLDASRIEQACETPVTMCVARVRDVLAPACDMVESILHERKQTLHVEICPSGLPDSALLWCDPARLSQALGGTLLNASHFSDDGKGIVLVVAADGIFLELQVSDCGIGVEAADLPLLFEPFRKFAVHPDRVSSGAGLGLAIARSVIRAHGGMVSADSAGRGQGTRVKFVLPVVLNPASV